MSKKKIIALIITILLLVLILYKINWTQLFETFKDFDFKNMWLIVPLYVSTLYIRGIRWKALLLNNPKYTSLNLAEIFTVGSMLNVFLPARAGDVYRAYYLGAVKKERKMKVFGSIILERIFDGICVFCILFAAVLLYFKQPWILNLAYGIGALFIGSLIFFYVIFKFDKLEWLRNISLSFIKKLPDKLDHSLSAFANKAFNYAKSFMDGFEAMGSAKYFTSALILSFIVWGIECYVAYLIIDSFALGLKFSAGLFVISLISFSTMIPSTSVFLGPYQVAYIMALGIFGISKSQALAVSTIHQAILMLMLTVIGGIYLLKFNISMKDIEEKQ